MTNRYETFPLSVLAKFARAVDDKFIVWLETFLARLWGDALCRGEAFPRPRQREPRASDASERRNVRAGGRRRPRLAPPRPARPTPSAPVPRERGVRMHLRESSADPSQRLAAASPPAASAGPSARRTEFASVRGRRRISHSHGVRPTHTPTTSEANAECRRTVVCGRRPLHLVFNGLSGEKPFASFFAAILFVREYINLSSGAAALLPFVRTRARARPGTAPALSLLRAAGRSDAFERPKAFSGADGRISFKTHDVYMCFYHLATATLYRLLCTPPD